MREDRTIEKKGKAIPFQQPAAFYRRRGEKELERNDLVAAISKYREAYARAPEDPEIALELAEILCQMQRYEESNRILLPLMHRDDFPAEGYFGLACNFFGLQEYDTAADHLENYLDEEPDGFYAYDAEDMLDLIEDDDAMFAATGMMTDDDYEDNAVIRFVRALIQSGETECALEEIERRAEMAPLSMAVKEQLAITYFCADRRLDAKKTAEAILTQDEKNVSALCTLALIDLDEGNKDAAIARLEKAKSAAPQSAENLHSIAILELDLERFSDAEASLTQLSQVIPYDENVLHKLAYARYMQGDVARAEECYKKLIRINPRDTVARYYGALCRRAEGLKRSDASRWVIAYQVPFGETYRRLNRLNRLLNSSNESLMELWNQDQSFCDLVVWSLSLGDMRIKKSILSLLYALGDERAKRYLCDYLLRTDQPDELKRVVFGMLKRLGVAEPYMAYLNGRWISGRVNLVEFDYKLPVAYENVMHLLLQYMLGSCRDECTNASARIYRRYIESLNRKFPRLSLSQEVSYAAALEFLGRKACGEPIPEEDIGKVYRVSLPRLRNAVKKFEAFADEEEQP